jgi:MFS transporter, ACS family, D-galactonate transporter
MNFLNNLIGVVASITTGYIVGATHSFTGASMTEWVVLIVGILAYVLSAGLAGSDPGPGGLRMDAK